MLKDTFKAPCLVALNMCTYYVCWDHAIDTIFKLSTHHSDGRSLRKWIQYQNMDSTEQLYKWDERHLAI